MANEGGRVCGVMSVGRLFRFGSAPCRSCGLVAKVPITKTIQGQTTSLAYRFLFPFWIFKMYSFFVPVLTPHPLSATPAIQVPSNCSNGLAGYQDGTACCLEACGMCGGVGCGTVTGTRGASDCCPSTIIEANQICGSSIVAPCVIPCKCDVAMALLRTVSHPEHLNYFNSWSKTTNKWKQLFS